MHAARKTALSALTLLVLAVTAGCAAGDEDAAREGAILASTEADEAPGHADRGDAPGNISVTVNIDSNDHFGGGHHACGCHPGGGHGIHGGHHGCGSEQALTPAAPPPAPPAPPPAQPPPG